MPTDLHLTTYFSEAIFDQNESYPLNLHINTWSVNFCNSCQLLPICYKTLLYKFSSICLSIHPSIYPFSQSVSQSFTCPLAQPPVHPSVHLTLLISLVFTNCREKIKVMIIIIIIIMMMMMMVVMMTMATMDIDGTR